MRRLKCSTIAMVPLCLLVVIASCLAQNCGMRMVLNFLIVNGTESKEGYWPWHVALFRKTIVSFEYACGGTILNENTVLTAAHCLMTSEGIIARDRIQVQVGRNRLRVASTHTQEHNALELIVHPKYSINSLRHDIALIKLSTDIIYNDYVQPICLWNRGEDMNAIIGTYGAVIGFDNGETDNPSDVLREARIPLVSHITCIESNRELFGLELTSNMFCAGSRDGVGPCGHDAGGGLYFSYNNVWFIRGIVSYTPYSYDTKMCEQKDYSLFTDVAKYLNWIEGLTKLDPTSSLAHSCGKRKVPNSLIRTGVESKDGYWPWHAAIFIKNLRLFFYACGGTILDQYTVLTAAHCLMTSEGIIEQGRLVVQVGRIRLHVPSDHSQEHGVSRLIVHPFYMHNNIQDDIALIKLATDITYTDYIQPICLWNRGEDQDAIVGSVGTAIGFGIGETDNPSNKLREVYIPVVSSITCIESNRETFGELLTSDMFCAGRSHGIVPCTDDSGGGFFFNYRNTWFIRGLVSFTPYDNNANMCDEEKFTVFTDVAKYLEWIEKPTQLNQDSSLAQNCGKRKVPTFLVVNGTASKEGYWPWHVAIFHKTIVSFEYACGGTILNENTVLTAAHCLMTSEGIMAKEHILVQVGRNRLRVASAHAQEHKAIKLIVHPEFNRIRHDIGLIKLATNITYNDYIQPICLWNRGEEQHPLVGSYGTVIGYGIDETDNPSNILLEVRIPIVEAITCVESNRQTFGYQLTAEMFCAGSRNRVGPCNGDSGGGFFFNFNDVWFIRGLVSFTQNRRNSHLCDTNEFTAFTDVAKYLEWIEQPIAQEVASSATQNCGKRKVQNAHTNNGTESKDGYWPWHATIFHNEFRFFVYTCGGTILDPNTVLTAAHCLMASDGIIAAERLVVHLQRNRIRVAINRPEEYRAFELLIHPEYYVNGHRHDIALIKLAADIAFNDYTQPICLWNRDEDQNAIVSSLGTVLGYGIEGTDNAVDTLYETRIPIVSATTCIESNTEAFTSQITSDMFCAGNRNETRTSYGEDGGGLIFNYTDGWFIRGVASFAPIRQKATKNEYTVFTDVAKHLKWIKKHMRQSGGRPMLTKNYYNRKIKLLPTTTCGEYPHVSREESSNSVLLGYPWVGLLQYNQAGLYKKKIICEVTLISDLYVITGASCISRLHNKYNLSSILLGEFNKNTTTDCADVYGQTVCAPPVQSLRIETVISHPGYNNPRYANNIAVIRLRDRADTSQSNVKPICLPVTNELRNHKSTHYTLTPWDLIEREVIDSIECQKLYNNPFLSTEITTRHICIRQQQENDSACKLPTPGAPIQLTQQVEGKNRYVVYGVLSHGPKKCGLPYPDVYTSVTSYVDWILKNIQE